MSAGGAEGSSGPGAGGGGSDAACFISAATTASGSKASAITRAAASATLSQRAPWRTRPLVAPSAVRSIARRNPRGIASTVATASRRRTVAAGGPPRSFSMRAEMAAASGHEAGADHVRAMGSGELPGPACACATAGAPIHSEAHAPSASAARLRRANEGEALRATSGAASPGWSLRARMLAPVTHALQQNASKACFSRTIACKTREIALASRMLAWIDRHDDPGRVPRCATGVAIRGPSKGALAEGKVTQRAAKAPETSLGQVDLARGDRAPRRGRVAMDEEPGGGGDPDRDRGRREGQRARLRDERGGGAGLGEAGGHASARRSRAAC